MIRAQRLAGGLSQENLADSIGLTFQQIQKYEKGVNRIAAGRLVKVAEILGVDASFFLPDNKGTESGLIKLVATIGAPELLRAFAAVKSTSTRAAVVALLQSIAESETITAPAETRHPGNASL